MALGVGVGVGGDNTRRDAARRSRGDGGEPDVHADARGVIDDGGVEARDEGDGRQRQFGKDGRGARQLRIHFVASVVQFLPMLKKGIAPVRAPYRAGIELQLICLHGNAAGIAVAQLHDIGKHQLIVARAPHIERCPEFAVATHGNIERGETADRIDDDRFIEGDRDLDSLGQAVCVCRGHGRGGDCGPTCDHGPRIDLVAQLAVQSRELVEHRTLVRSLLCDAGPGRHRQRTERNRHAVAVLIGVDDRVAEDEFARAIAGNIGCTPAVLANQERQGGGSGHVDRFGERDGCRNDIARVVRTARSQLNSVGRHRRLIELNEPAGYSHGVRARARLPVIPAIR